MIRKIQLKLYKEQSLEGTAIFLNESKMYKLCLVMWVIVHFKVLRIHPNISKDPKQKYKLHYDDVRGDVLRPLHSKTPAAVK